MAGSKRSAPTRNFAGPRPSIAASTRSTTTAKPPESGDELACSENPLSCEQKTMLKSGCQGSYSPRVRRPSSGARVEYDPWHPGHLLTESCLTSSPHDTASFSWGRVSAMDMTIRSSLIGRQNPPRTRYRRWQFGFVRAVSNNSRQHDLTPLTGILGNLGAHSSLLDCMIRLTTAAPQFEIRCQGDPLCHDASIFALIPPNQFACINVHVSRGEWPMKEMSCRTLDGQSGQSRR
jgi:hypothetical protein